MEITLLQEDSIRIKGKRAAFVVDPETVRTKTEADAVLLLKKDGKTDFEKIEGYRVIVKASGEYEISGVKISGFAAKNDMAYEMHIDSLSILLVSSSFIAQKQKEWTKEYSVVIVKAEDPLEASILTEFSPRVLVLYGQKAHSFAKELGKESSAVSKFQTTSEKLPEEMQVVILQ